MNKYRLENLPRTPAPVSLNTLAFSFEVLGVFFYIYIYKEGKIKRKKITSRVDGVNTEEEKRSRLRFLKQQRQQRRIST